MKERNIKDVSKVGLYGLTYKEDVDDTRESPSIQLLEKMAAHLAHGIKSYAPFLKETIIEGQYTDFNKFLDDVEIVVIMVSHTHIKENMDKLSNKFILDTKNICSIDGTCKL